MTNKHLGNISSDPECLQGTTHISELDQTQLPELSHAAVSSLHLQEELHQAHLLTAEDRGHFGWPPPAQMSPGASAAAWSSSPREVLEGAEHCRNTGIAVRHSVRHSQSFSLSSRIQRRRLINCTLQLRQVTEARFFFFLLALVV